MYIFIKNLIMGEDNFLSLRFFQQCIRNFSNLFLHPITLLVYDDETLHWCGINLKNTFIVAYHTIWKIIIRKWQRFQYCWKGSKKQSQICCGAWRNSNFSNKAVYSLFMVESEYIIKKQFIPSYVENDVFIICFKIWSWLLLPSRYAHDESLRSGAKMKRPKENENGAALSDSGSAIYWLAFLHAEFCNLRAV